MFRRGHKGHQLILGTYGSWWRRRSLILHGTELSRHKHVIGVTGQGKSKLLAASYVQLLRQGIPAALIDPHADLADDVLSMLNDEGLITERFLYVDFGRKDFFLPFNILKTRYSAHDTARHVVEVCKRVWPALGAGAAPAFENIVLHGAYALIETGYALTDLPTFIVNKGFRDQVLSQVSDPRVISFWRDYFDQLPERDRAEEVQSAIRRMALLTFDPTMRYSLGQKENVLDFRKLMDDGISVVFSLGGLDEETQKFLGCLLTVGYEVAALSRADQALWERKPYHLFLDEFSQFSATSEEGLARILSLARKYQLSLVMAHQTFSQTSDRIKGALGNAMRIVFQLEPDDAAWMAQQLGEYEPHEVKHEVEDESAQGRTHPVFFSVQESYEKLRSRIKNLKPRHAIVKTGHGYQEIKTLHVPPPKTSRSELREIKERYAKALMTKKQIAVDMVDRQVEEDAPPLT